MGKVVWWSVFVALGGFLFGFDTAVISGADQPLQRLWQTSDLVHGALIMSSALWGTVIGALGGHIPCDKLGRRRSLFLIGFLYLGSALGSALATDPVFFAIMRFAGGLGVGISSIVVPAYISEIAPPSHRGRLVALYQFQLVFGILVAYASNFLLAQAGLDWRWMLGAEAIPAMIFLAAVFTVPESPRWLIVNRGDASGGRAILEMIDADSANQVIEEINQTARHALTDRLFSRRYAFPALLVFLLALFNQLSGINFIIYFAPRVFDVAGLDEASALLSTVGIGIVNLLGTMLGLYLIDRAGRRKLMLLGSVGYILSLLAVAWAFNSDAGGMTVVGFVLLFILSHAIGQGAVIWVFIAEVFPNSIRTRGQSLGCGTHWVAAAVIALLMPYFLGQFAPESIFVFFAAMMVLQLLYVLFLMPETRGRSIESLGESLSNRPSPAAGS